MTLVLVGKGLVLRGLPSKIKVIWALGTYNMYIYMYISIYGNINIDVPRAQLTSMF